jgi:proteasome lid subunit RPN8/RPN11
LDTGIEVDRSVIDAVVAHARETAPAECCGVLLGCGTVIVDSIAARNIAGSPRSRFVIDPRDHIAARRTARGRGLDVVGFYHSHPRTAAAPSETDAAEASYSDHVHLIVSLANDEPDVRLFRFVDATFRALAFAMVRETPTSGC